MSSQYKMTKYMRERKSYHKNEPASTVKRYMQCKH